MDGPLGKAVGIGKGHYLKDLLFTWYVQALEKKLSTHTQEISIYHNFTSPPQLAGEVGVYVQWATPNGHAPTMDEQLIAINLRTFSQWIYPLDSQLEGTCVMLYWQN